MITMFVCRYFWGTIDHIDDRTNIIPCQLECIITMIPCSTIKRGGCGGWESGRRHPLPSLANRIIGCRTTHGSETGSRILDGNIKVTAATGRVQPVLPEDGLRSAKD